MQKRPARSLQLAALLAASASAQTITSTIPVCPTASSTTITLPTTVTFCPGPHCNGGGGPMITPAPNGVGQQGIHLGEYTSIGPDGKTTVLGIWETVFDSLCETGLVPATWTITEDCGCTEAPAPTVMPVGFETTVVPCTVCGPHSTVTLTQPCPTGPYATQTPSVGKAPAPAGAAAAPAGQAPVAASAGAGAGAGASSGPGGASASAGAGANAQAGSASASAGAGAGAGAQAGPNGASAGAGAGANANAGTVSPASAAGAPASPGGIKAAPVNGTVSATNSTRPVTNAPIQSYVSSATHASVAGFTIFAGVIASLLL